MTRTVYGTPTPRPARSRTRSASALVLATLLLGCDGEAPEGGTGPVAPVGPPAVGAAERDASLDAIDRWLQAGRTDNAEAVARALVDRLPDDRHARTALGRVLLARSGELRMLAGDPAATAVAAQAAEALASAVAATTVRDATAIEARRSLGLALESAGRPEEAAAVYRDGAEDPVCRLYLGLVLLRLEDVAAASAVLGDLAKDRPDDAMVRAAFAEAAFRESRPEDALAAMNEAVRLDPDSWPVRVRRASLLRRLDRPREALESLLALPATVRSERAVVEEIATDWLALGRPEDAAAAWAARARETPEDLDAALEAARAFEAAGRTTEAETWLGLAEATRPGDPRIAAVRAEIATSRSGD